MFVYLYQIKGIVIESLCSFVTCLRLPSQILLALFSWPEILDSQRSARGLVTISSFARGHENIKLIDSNYILMRHGEWLERNWRYAWFLPSNA